MHVSLFQGRQLVTDCMRAGNESLLRGGKARLAALLWIINLSSISASVLVYIYLSYYAYKVVNSVLLSEFVLFAPMVIPVVLVFQINQITSFLGAKKLLLLANLAGIIVCAGIFSLLGIHPAVTLIGAAAIGTLDAIQRVTRIVVIKQYFSANEVKFTVPLTLTAQFIAGGMAGSVLAFFPGQITLLLAAATAAVLFAIATLSAALLPPRPPELEVKPSTGTASSRMLELLRTNKPLRESFFNFVLLCAFFQGFYNISRVVLPAHHLGLSQQYVGLLQVVASSAALVGALFFYFFSKRGMRFPPVRLYTACAIAMMGACFFSSALSSFALYFVYFFIFELLFFSLQGDIVTASPMDQIPLVATVQYALVYTGMMLTISVGAFLVESFGLLITSVLFIAAFGTAHGIKWLVAARRALLNPEKSIGSQDPA